MAYQELKPLERSAESTSGAAGPQASTPRTPTVLPLANGARIFHTADLLPLVPRTSAAAQAAERAEAREGTADALSAIRWGLIIAGAGVALLPVTTPRESGEAMDTSPLYAGLGMMGLSLAFTFWEVSERRAANAAKARTFELYAPALRERLNICEQGDVTVPCEATPDFQPTTY
jgi:hypothetical protein